MTVLHSGGITTVLLDSLTQKDEENTGLLPPQPENEANVALGTEGNISKVRSLCLFPSFTNRWWQRPPPKLPLDLHSYFFNSSHNIENEEGWCRYLLCNNHIQTSQQFCLTYLYIISLLMPAFLSSDKNICFFLCKITVVFLFNFTQQSIERNIKASSSKMG